MNKIKILVVCQHFWPESFRINDTCDFFIERGLEVDVLCGLPNYPKGKLYEGYSLFGKRHETHNGVKIERVLEIPRGNNSNFRIFINYISFPFFSLFHLPKLLFKKYDKIFIYQYSPVYMGLVGIIIGKIKKIETTIYILDLWPENLYSVLSIKNNFFRKIIKTTSLWHYRNADKIVTISEKMRSNVMNALKFSSKNVIFVPQTCEKLYEVNIPDNTLRNRFSKGLNIVFAGNISPAQDFETVLQAAEMLKNRSKEKINWIIVGDGMSLNWLKNEVRKRALDDCFYFEGQKPKEEIPKYHHIADGLLACLVKSPLLDATIPAKVMSYFASGKPIILAMDGEASSIVKNVECGFSGPSGDPDTLYKNILKLQAMKNTDRVLMGRKGRDYYFAHFERNNNLEKLYNFIIN